MTQRELLQLFVLANEFKEGDLLVGGTRDERLRLEARSLLSSLRLGEIAGSALLDDGVSEALARAQDTRLAAEICGLSVSKLKSILLNANGAAWAQRYRDGLSSEMIAAVVKVMTNAELSALAQSLFNPLPGEGVSIGSPHHFGSRLQPNSPGDDEEEILLSILEGLAYGCGDCILGINPAGDRLETIIRLEELLGSVVERLKLPTRYCVLSDILKQSSARARTNVDVGFQSLAGTSKALNGMVGMDAPGILDLARGFDGLYFETGQGAEVTNGAAQGLDMLTLEARTYGVARYIQKQTARWMIVNDVAGFIGPEVFRTGEQLLRACLEDTVMAKLHGLTMGLDVCSTFHMGIEPRALRQLTSQIVEQAAPAYLMAVAGNTDPMLGYMTTSFRDHARLRRLSGKRISTAMQRRLVELGVMTAKGDLSEDADRTEALYARYMKAGGDARSSAALRAAAARKINALRQRGRELGYGRDQLDENPPEVEARMAAIYRHARHALYATLDAAVIKDASPQHVRVRTRALDREEYLSHPPAGERLSDEAIKRLKTLYALRRPQVQIVISDGLNANSLNENLRAVLPRLRRELNSTGYHLGEIDVIIENGRVRAGYHTGALMNPELIIHLIGERPGTGLNTLSAYLTYGRDEAGQTRWRPDLDHSCTTAICGIHPQGKPPQTAAEEAARCVRQMFERRCSGVALGFT